MARNLFNSVKQTRPQKNRFDLTHDVKLSLNMGKLVPIMVSEVIPGDHFKIRNEILMRFAPLVSPVMHRIDVYTHYFFVPNRILWPNWEKFIMNGQETPDNLPAFPVVTVDENNYGPLYDYLGIPAPIGEEFENISALPFAAYQKVYDEYYRDQNLIDSLDIELHDGSNQDLNDLFQLRTRAWQHDYFTSSLPFAQKGAAVLLPVGELTDVEVYADVAAPVVPGDQVQWDGEFYGPGSAFNVVVDAKDVGSSADGGRLYAAVSEADLQATTINDFRRAIRLQEYLEKNARGGTRYTEGIWSHFGVKSQDARLQRPEYITGTKTAVTISEVLNTTGTEDAPQGNMAGHGIAVSGGNGGSYYAFEHGYIIGIMSVMPKPAYMQGIPKHFFKITDPFQYFWPSFANLGEQPVEKREIYAFQGQDNGKETFGYVPRYAEYKFENNRVAGEFRTTLDFWHLARKFATPPLLNQSFVECNPTTRIFAVEDEDSQKLYAHVLNIVQATRGMPKFGTPTI